MKRITLLTVRTQDDVRPFIAPGLGLLGSGYAVMLATSERFAALVTSYGLPHTPVLAEFLELADTAGGKASLGLKRKATPLLPRMLDGAGQVIAPATAAKAAIQMIGRMVPPN